MGKPLTFESGIPTAPDVKKLHATFGVPKIGAILPYDDVAAVIGSPKDTHRYKSVTWAWRRELERDHNVLVETVARKGFIALDPHERVRSGGRRYKRGMRAVQRAGAICAATDRSELTPEENRAADHIVSVSATIKLQALTAARSLKKLQG